MKMIMRSKQQQKWYEDKHQRENITNVIKTVKKLKIDNYNTNKLETNNSNQRKIKEARWHYKIIIAQIRIT